MSKEILFEILKVFGYEVHRFRGTSPQCIRIIRMKLLTDAKLTYRVRDTPDEWNFSNELPCFQGSPSPSVSVESGSNDPEGLIVMNVSHKR